MKKLYSIGLTVLLLSSCKTNIVNHEKPYSDSKLKLEKHYTFYLKKNVKHKLYITKIDSLNIYGEDVLSNPKTIQKSDIIIIKKANSLGTAGIVVGVAAAAILIPAYSSNSPVGQ